MIHVYPGRWKKKPCHLKKTPQQHEWELDIFDSYGSLEADVVCQKCDWAFDPTELLGLVTMDDMFFHIEGN